MDSPPTITQEEVDVSLLLCRLKQARHSRVLAQGFLLIQLPFNLVALLIWGLAGAPFWTGIALTALFGNIFILKACIKQELEVLVQLSAYLDARSIPALLDTLMSALFPDEIYSPVITALDAVLPFATSSNRGAIKARHFDFLHSLFSHYHDRRLNDSTDEYRRFEMELPAELCRSLRVGALHTLTEVGGQESVRVLKQFVREQEGSRKQKSLQQLAVEALHELEARLEHENEAKTLLRASDLPNDSLLRPSYAQASEPSETLLRVATTSREEEESY